MMRMSRRNGIVSAIVLGLCISMTGCLSTNFDQPNMGGAPAYPRSPTLPPPTGGLPAPIPTLVRGPDGVQRVAYTQPQAQFGPATPGAPDGVVMEGNLGMPSVLPPGMAMPFDPPLPTEKAMTTFAPHKVAAPDILLIEALRLIPKGPYRLEPLEVLQIDVPDALPKQEIKGLYMISPDGRINLGHTYGSVAIAGMTVEQAQLAIRNYINPIIKGANVNVALVQMRAVQNIRGDHLVRPDGTIHLGMYGSVFVAGMTLGEVKCTIENYLAAYLVNPQVSVDVKAYNSRKIYIVADTFVNFRQRVIALPATGNETVLDAISKVEGLPEAASLKKIWVARPSPVGHPCSTVLPVDWKAITQAGRTETNYQLLPGDRIYISSDPFIAAFYYIDRVLAPFERVATFMFSAGTALQSFRGNGAGVVVAQ